MTQSVRQEPKEKNGSFLKEYLFPKMLFLTVGFPKDAFGSVDITNRCNLRCKHCYFFEQENPEELTDQEWIDRFKQMASGPNRTRSVTWVGGEPLLRKSLIEIGRHYFRHNIVVTNGLIRLPEWDNVSFHLSIDGDEAAHEKQRNERGIYRQIMKNADRPELDVTIAYCITSLNVHCVEKVLAEWKDVGIRGFLFSFYTPIESIEDPLFPGWDERDRLLDRLIELKETKYGDFIQIESRVLELMKRENAKKVTDKCAFFTKGFSLDPHGNRKNKCMLGDKADCDRCGCIVPFYLYWRTERKNVLNQMMQDFSSYMSSRARHLFQSSRLG